MALLRLPIVTVTGMNSTMSTVRCWSNGLKPVGLSPDGKLVEIVEVASHPWFVGVQFHPELKSRPLRPHPLFREFVHASVKYHERKLGGTKSDEPRTEDVNETVR